MIATKLHNFSLIRKFLLNDSDDELEIVINCNADFTDYRLKRIFYRCRYRGTKEMDIIMENFALHYLSQFDADELDEFEKICDLDDDSLYSLLLAKDNIVVADITDGKVFELLKDFTEHRRAL